MRSASPHSAAKRSRLGPLPVDPVPRPADPPVEVSGAAFSIEWLRARADMSSSVLEEILKRHRPEPRWGINE